MKNVPSEHEVELAERFADALDRIAEHALNPDELRQLVELSHRVLSNLDEIQEHPAGDLADLERRLQLAANLPSILDEIAEHPAGDQGLDRPRKPLGDEREK